MKICVDLDKCKSHGQCVIAAPKIFSFAEDNQLIWVDQPEEALRKAAEEAADVCPEQAITIED